MVRRGAILGIAGISIAALGGVAIGDVVLSRAEVSVSVDSVVRPAVVWRGSAHDALEAANVTVGPYDKVIVGDTEIDRPHLASVSAGDSVKVFSARPLAVLRGEETVVVQTTAQSIAAALKETGADAIARSQVAESGLPLSEQDTEILVRDQTHEGPKDYSLAIDEIDAQLNPLDEARYALDDSGDLVLDVVRVTKETIQERNETPPAVEEKTDPDLFEGEWVREVEGKPGIAESEALVFRRGQDVTHRVVVEDRVEEPKQEIRRVGSRKVTPIALIEAGLDPKASLQEVRGETLAMRFVGELGTISSAEEIQRIKDDAYGADDSQEEVTVAASTPEIPIGTYSGEDPRGIAQEMLQARGQSGEFSCLLNLWERESGWNPYASNPSSGAYGIPQSLPGSKMASAGADWQTNPRTQITWGLGYIEGRYGTPCGAWSFFQANNWY